MNVWISRGKAFALSGLGKVPVAVATVLLLPAATGLAADAVPFWPTGSEFTLEPAGALTTGDAGFSSVACAGLGSCEAVGGFNDSGGTEAMVAPDSGGTWGQATKVALPAGALEFHGTPLEAIACPAAGSCTAGGSYLSSPAGEEPMVAAQSGGVWGQAAELALPAGAKTTGQAAVVTSMACTSVGNCEAVGRYVDSAGNAQALAATETSGTWGAATKVALPSGAATTNPRADMLSVACTGAGSCVAVGQYNDSGNHGQAMVATESGGVWGQATKLALPADASVGNQGAALSGVACTTPGACVATGYYTDTADNIPPMVATETGGAWAPASRITLPVNAATAPGDGYGGLYSVSCAAPGACVAVGQYKDSSGSDQAMTASQTGGTWAPARELALPANATAAAGAQEGYPAGVTCTAAASCVAVGSYEDTGNVSRAMTVASGPTLSVTTTALAPAVAGSPYAAQLQASGGAGQYAWSVASGALPAGLSLNASTGVISGTPTAAGNAAFNAAVSDPGPPAQQATSGTLSIAVGPPGAASSVTIFHDQRITLTTPSPSTCTATNGKLAVSLSSAHIAHSKATKLRFSKAAFYLDRGIKHTRHKTKRTRSGKKRKVLVTTYTPNATAKHVPASESLPLSGLKSGAHKLKVLVSYKETVRRHRHKVTVTIMKTISATFKVC